MGCDSGRSLFCYQLPRKKPPGPESLRLGFSVIRRNQQVQLTSWACVSLIGQPHFRLVLQGTQTGHRHPCWGSKHGFLSSPRASIPKKRHTHVLCVLCQTQNLCHHEFCLVLIGVHGFSNSNAPRNGSVSVYSPVKATRGGIQRHSPVPHFCQTTGFCVWAIEQATNDALRTRH